jgi:DNA-binding GntR family transcriptional regulator
MTKSHKSRNRARSTEVCNRLRGMIRSGELGMGQRLKQLHVARRLNASQTPVREAIRTLEQEGWLVSEFGRGTRVRELTPKFVDELFEMRELLEGFMARKAALLLSQDQIATLRALASAADAMEQPGEEPGDEAASKHDLAFHLELAAMVENSIVLEFYQRLCNQGSLLVALSVKFVPPVSVTPHGDLVDAIESRQPDWAEAVARRLLRLARDRTRDALARGLPAFRVAADGTHAAPHSSQVVEPGRNQRRS